MEIFQTQAWLTQPDPARVKNIFTRTHHFYNHTNPVEYMAMLFKKDLSYKNVITHFKITLVNFEFSKEKKTKRSEVSKKSCYPQYRESLSFKLEEQEMESCGIKLVLIQKLSFPERGKARFFQ